MQYIVKTDKPLWVRENPDKDSTTINIVKPNETFEAIDYKDDWIKSYKGWIYTKNSSGDLIVVSNIYDSKKVKMGFAASSPSGRSSGSATDFLKKDDDGNLVVGERYTKDGIEYTVIEEDGGYVATAVNPETGSTSTWNIDNTGDNVTRTVYMSNADGVDPNVISAKNVTVINPDGTQYTEVWKTDEDGDPYYERTEYNADGTVKEGPTKYDPDESDYYRLDDQETLEALQSTEMFATSPEIKSLRIKNIQSVLGMPYQYMESVDRRLDSSNDGAFGRRYAEKIVARMPLLIMSAGEPNFMGGMTEDEKKDVVQRIIDESAGDLNDVTKKGGRYYTFKERSDLYMKYVSPLCQAGAHFLGIADKVLPYSGGVSLDTYNWANYNDPEISAKLNYRNSVAFYIHSDTQISDSFSNGTTKSQLADKVNQYSDMAREIGFLVGSAGGALMENKYTNAVGTLQNQQNSQDFMNDMLGGGNMLSAIGANLLTVAKGGKLIFPEIWSDSSFTKSYSVTIKLRTNDCDPLSWYLNILVPICFLLPLVGPKQDGVNGYISPFIVRAFYKGLFNCQMGIITDMNISRGESGKWTMNGLPTAVDINFTIKDLYDVLALSPGDQTLLGLMNNVALLDYIANICGININEPDLSRLAKMYYGYFKANVKNILELNGYKHYEISNFAKKGKESKKAM